MKTQEEETELSEMFEKQSSLLRSEIDVKENKLKDSLNKNMKEYMKSKWTNQNQHFNVLGIHLFKN